MVLKKSKHDLNTGNTLRNHDLELRQNVRGLVECRVDSVKIGDVANSLYNSLHHDEGLFVVGYLEDVLEISNSLEVICSLSKKSRWSLVNTLLSKLDLIAELSQTISSLSINIQVVTHCELKKSHRIPLHPSTIWSKEKETPLMQHDRGVQRCSYVKKRRSDRGEATTTNDHADIECNIWEASESASSLLSRQPKTGGKIRIRPNLKGSKRSAMDWQEDLVGFRGCSATEVCQHEMDYSNPRKHYPERKSTAYRNKKPRSKNESSVNQVFLTECTSKKKPSAQLKASVKEETPAAVQENQLMLWQFVGVLVDDSVAPSVTVTFKNCKRGSKCSRKEMQAARVNDLESESEFKNNNKKKKFTMAEESAQYLSRSQLKKKGNSVTGLSSQPDSAQSVLLQVKSKDLVPEFLRQNYGYRYCEATCWPRTFWINMSDNSSSTNTVDLAVNVSSKTESTRTEPTSITNLPCFRDFSCFLLFSESVDIMSINQAKLSDSLLSRPSSSISRPSSGKGTDSRPSSSLKIRNTKGSNSLVSLTIKMLVDSSTLQKAYARLEELLPSKLVHNVVDIVDCVTLVIKDMNDELRLEAEKASGCCHSMGDSSFSRLEWMKSACQWQFDIYEPSVYSSMLTKRILSASPRNVPSRHFKHVDKEQCALCRSQLTIYSRPSSASEMVSKSRKSNLIPASDDKFSRASYDVRIMANCRHCVCVSCLSNAIKSRLENGDALEVCPVEGCLTELDSPTLLSVVPLSVYRAHLQASVDQKILLYPQWKRCPNESCHRAVRLSGACLLEKTVSIVCHCGTAWCFHCLKDSHWPALCSEYNVYRQYQIKEGLEKCNPLFSVLLETPVVDPCSVNVQSGSTGTMAMRNVFSPMKLPMISSVSVSLEAKNTPENRTAKPYDWLLNAKLDIAQFPTSSSLPSRVPRGVRLLPLAPVHPKPFKCGLPNMSNAVRNSNSAENRRRQLPELIKRKSTQELLTFDCTSYASSKWEMCLRCHDLTDSALALSMDYTEHRTWAATQVKSTLVPILVYRSALNHRSLRLTWSRPTVEHQAKLRATQIVKARQADRRHQYNAARLISSGTIESTPMTLSEYGLLVPKLTPEARRKLEAKAVLILSVQQFVLQVHTLLEYVYVAIFSNWQQPSMTEQLRLALRLEAILDSIIKMLDVTARCPKNFSSKLQRLVTEGRSEFRQLISISSGLPRPTSSSSLPAEC